MNQLQPAQHFYAGVRPGGVHRFGVAEAAQWVFPGHLATGHLLPAPAVSTTDAVAATSIARRLSLPQRIVDLLEGESLVNDAGGLVALEFGLAMVMRGQTPTLDMAIGRFVSHPRRPSDRVGDRKGCGMVRAAG